MLIIIITVCNAYRRKYCQMLNPRYSDKSQHALHFELKENTCLPSSLKPPQDITCDCCETSKLMLVFFKSS